MAASFATVAILALAMGADAQTRACKYANTNALQTALNQFGCRAGTNDCSARCAHRFMPITRECRSLVGQLNLDRYKQVCIRTLHPTSKDTETGRECHDGRDNDGDGAVDCADSDCANNRHCRNSGGGGKVKCTSDATLPVILECSTWSKEAMADGKLTVSDGFCSSSCKNQLQPLWAHCQNRMAKSSQMSLSFLAPLLNTCQTHVASCKMNRITRHCGNNPKTAGNQCVAKCLKAIDVSKNTCGSNHAFGKWRAVAEGCADSHDHDKCAAASGKFLTFVDDSCCRDQNCKDVPQKCTAECAATFMPFFSRCGRAVFGKNRKALRKFEHFNRKCAKAAGRNVNTGDDNTNLDGPHKNDPCSKQSDCHKCNGECGWCAAEVKNAHVLHRNHGGWCSSSCVTTRGECKAHGGAHKENGRLCFNGKDDDHDGKMDCDDKDCKKDPRAGLWCKRTETASECFDGKDNDHDGKTDCADPNCRRYGRCRHVGGKETGRLCFDGKDNDHDGRSDCDDPDCRKDRRAARRCAHTETGRECFNGKDDDHDGKTDCQDPNCNRYGRCRHVGGKETGRMCFDGKDNDHDGKKDCDDKDCQRYGRCRHAGGHETGRMCFNGRDDDHDGRADCDDSDCKKDPRARRICARTETGRECFNGKDDDHDGKTDCQDPNCAKYGRCRHKHGKETGAMCFDGKDNDHDGRADCDDSDCLKDPRAARRCKHTETGRECFDGKDNDHDGKRDCQDPNCAKYGRCRHQHGKETGAMCFDGKDNDHDHRADCDDPDCRKDPRSRHKCAHTETGRECFNGKDDDHDGKKDCDDPDCKKYGRCRHVKGHESGRLCFDGKDNDHDGRSDCDDSDCRKDPRAARRCAHTETGRECFNGKDDDHDGKTDCQDPNCRRYGRCRHQGGRETGAMCFDGKDNDHDHRYDCDDPDCRKDPRAARRCKHTETGRECFDGKDNDHDGKTDCQDTNCQRDPRAKAHCQGH